MFANPFYMRPTAHPFYSSYYDQPIYDQSYNDGSSVFDEYWDPLPCRPVASPVKQQPNRSTRKTKKKQSACTTKQAQQQQQQQNTPIKKKQPTPTSSTKIPIPLKTTETNQQQQQQPNAKKQPQQPAFQPTLSCLKSLSKDPPLLEDVSPLHPICTTCNTICACTTHTSIHETIVDEGSYTIRVGVPTSTINVEGVNVRVSSKGVVVGIGKTTCVDVDVRDTVSDDVVVSVSKKECGCSSIEVTIGRKK